MTTVTGAWAPNATTNQRMQLILDYTATSTATHTTVAGTVKVGARYSFNDSNNIFAWSGSLLGSGSASKAINVASNSTQQIHTFSTTVPRTSAAQGMTVAFSLSGIEYVGVSTSATVSATVSIPAAGSGTTPAPPATSDVTLTRVSDSQHTARWTAVPDAIFYGLGRSINGGPYVWLGWVDAPQVTYSVSGTSSNQTVSLSVFARTASGDTPVKYSPLVYTTPANASNLTFTQTGPDRGTLTWARNAVAIGSQGLQVSTNNGATWADLAGHTTLSASTYSRGITGLSAGPAYQFRVITRTPAPVLTSASGGSTTRSLSSPPAAPTNVTATRNSDGSWTVSWSGTADAWRVTRSINGGAWTNVATNIAGGTRTATITGSTTNQWLRFAVVGKNVAGEGPSASSPSYYTTPLAADTVRASRLPNGDVDLTWRVRAAYGQTQDILAASRVEGGVWTTYSPVIHHEGLAAALTSATIPGLSLDREWRFAIRTHTTAPALSALSGASNVVAIGQRPHPPTLLAPTGPVAADEPVTFRWRFNSADSSEQTAYELRYSVGGAPRVTLTGASATERTISPSGSGGVEWEVRTKGQHADWSDWSTTGTFPRPERPAATVLEPSDEVVTDNRPRFLWDYQGGTGGTQIRWRAELRRSGQTIDRATGTTQRQATFTQPLAPDALHTFVLWVTSGSGIESHPVEYEFTTSFVSPTPPTITATWDAQTGITSVGFIGLQQTPAIPGLAIPGLTHPGTAEVSVVPTVAGRVERWDDTEGVWVHVGSIDGEAGGVDDWRAPLRTEVTYRAIAVAEGGGEAVSEPTVVRTESCRTFLNVDGARWIWLESNQNLDTTLGQHSTVEHYEGDDWPTAHYGLGRSQALNLTATLWDGEGLSQDLAALFGQDVYLRTPTGDAWWAHISPIGRQQDWYKLAQIRLTAQRVAGPRG